MKSWKILLKIAVAFLGGTAIIGEIVLRCGVGMCDAVLMRADDDYEYIAQPNQVRHRFGREIIYNSYSMRSEEVRKDALTILCVGDSLLNGGVLTDHKELATTILTEQLSQKYHRDVQVLNISAGSWGPDNAAAYLKKHGLFNAKMLILVTSSHDAHDTMTFEPIVGKLKYFPVKQYPLAWIELYDRYLCKRNTSSWMTKDEADEAFRKEHHIDACAAGFNPGFSQLNEIAVAAGIPFVICLHPELSEVKSRRYNPNGLEIIDFCKENGIDLIDELTDGCSPSLYRKNDCIHYNAQGQRKLAERLDAYIEQLLEK